MEKKVKDWKKAEVEELKNLIENHKVLVISGLNKVRTAQIQELRKKFRSEVQFKCVKNTLLNFALRESSIKKPNIEKLQECLDGSIMLLFTDLNPFKLSILFEKNKIKLPARAGDKAQTDIIIPEGNTGIPPGPIISEFSEVGLPTKIEGGSIWITKDTVALKKDEIVSHKLASILSRLGVKPMEAGLTLKAAYDEGAIYQQEILQVNLDELTRKLGEAITSAYNLTVNSSFPTPESLPILIGKAVMEAKNLTVNSMIIDKETLPILLGKCYCEGEALTKKLSEAELPS